jgi:DNA-binding NarL/FixJ family response regulator
MKSKHRYFAWFGYHDSPSTRSVMTRVVVLVAESVGGPDLERLRWIRAERIPSEASHSVIVTDDFGPAFTITAAEYGAMSVLPRALLVQLDDVRRGVLEPNGVFVTGLTQREVDVLQLNAEGRLTGEISVELAYSEALTGARGS